MRGRGSNLPSALLRACGQVVARPQLVLAFLLAGYLLALVLATPLASLLAEELDHNLYGDTLAEGPSFRWFDTVSRLHPGVLGDPGAWEGLFREAGLTAGDLGRLTGVPAAVAAAGLIYYWLLSLLHCGYLYTLRLGGEKGLVGLARGAARFALPATLLAAGTAVAYVGVYWLIFLHGGKLLEGLYDGTDSERVALGLLWARLLVTVLALLLVKLLFDLSRAVLVQRNSLNPLSALATASGELGRRGFTYLTGYLLLGVVSLAAVLLWWSFAAALPTAGAWGLGLALLCQQLFVAVRIGVRLAHFGTTFELYTGGRS